MEETVSDVPYRIGVCMEWNTSQAVLDDFYDGIRLACDEGFAEGRIKRPVELVIKKVKGPMAGLNSDVLRVFKELAYEENVLAILGPVVTEANLALAEEVTRARVPTISFCATLDWAGPYAYALPNGAFVDEAPLLAAYMAKQGWTKVGVSVEGGTIGDEFYAAFRQAAALYGLEIVSTHTVGMYKNMKPVRPQLEAIKAAGAQCLLALSGYGAVRYVIEEVRKMREEGPGTSPASRTSIRRRAGSACTRFTPETRFILRCWTVSTNVTAGVPPTLTCPLATIMAKYWWRHWPR